MDPTTAMYVAQGLHGLAYGMVLFLIASGLNVIFGMMGVLNLAHASFFMLSAYLGFQFVSLTGNFWMALLLAPVATAVCGVLMERFLLRKVRAFGHMGELILTVGVAQIVLAGVKSLWGSESLPLKMPPILEGQIAWAGLNYPVYRLFIIGIALVAIFGYRRVDLSAKVLTVLVLLEYVIVLIVDVAIVGTGGGKAEASYRDVAIEELP